MKKNKQKFRKILENSKKVQNLLEPFGKFKKFRKNNYENLVLSTNMNHKYDS